MKVSLVLVQNSFDGLTHYIKECESVLSNLVEKYEIIISTPVDIDQTQDLRSVKTLVCRENDYQQLVMAGVDCAEHECVILANSNYSPSIFKDMLSEYSKGAEIVCYKPKLSKINKMFATLSQGFYNLVLKAFGKELYTIGILKDIQLLSGEVLDVMKQNQSYAHRIRTMYAPFEYETKFLQLDAKNLSIDRPNTWLKPKLGAGFYVASILTILILLSFVGGVVASIILNATFVIYFLITFLALLFGFLTSAIAVNSIARAKIGLLHSPNRHGQIYKIHEVY